MRPDEVRDRPVGEDRDVVPVGRRQRPLELKRGDAVDPAGGNKCDLGPRIIRCEIKEADILRYQGPLTLLALEPEKAESGQTPSGGE